MDIRLKLALTISRLKSTSDIDTIRVVMNKAVGDLVDADISGLELKKFMRDLQIELIKLAFTMDGRLNLIRLQQSIHFMTGIDRMFNENFNQFDLN